jgi:DME family drug/metabolite transporter
MSHRAESGSSLAALQLIGAAVLFSTGGAVIKAIALDSWQIASFRSGIAALTILVALPGARRRWSWRTLLAGSAYAATLILYVQANKLTTAANTIFLQSTAPLYLLLLGPILLHEKLRRAELALMGLIVVGFALFFVSPDQATDVAANPALGNVLAAASGVTWALTLVALRFLSRGAQGEAGSGAAAVACGNLLAFAVCLPAALPVGSIRPMDGAMLLYLGAIQIGLAYVLVLAGMRHVPAFEASLLLLVEPVLNPVWSWWVHAERPTAWALAGGAIILVATAVKILFDWRRRPPSRAALGSSGPGATPDPS